MKKLVLVLFSLSSLTSNSICQTEPSDFLGTWSLVSHITDDGIECAETRELGQMLTFNANWTYTKEIRGKGRSSNQVYWYLSGGEIVFPEELEYVTTHDPRYRYILRSDTLFIWGYPNACGSSHYTRILVRE